MSQKPPRQAEVCEEEGGSYTLSGCSPIVCVEPPAEETYDYNVTVYPGDDERAAVFLGG